MSQLRHRYQDFRQADAEVAVVSFAHSKALAHYASGLRLPFPALSDPDRSAYQAYGLRKASTWAVFGPQIVWTYVKLISRGRLFRGIQADPYQLGGDFVITGEGVVRFAYRSEDPTDRPSMDQLLEAVHEARAG